MHSRKHSSGIAHVSVQVVHYAPGDAFGMHHDSSAFLPRFLTAFYYLNDVDAGGETAFPAADGAMRPEEAMALGEPAAEGVGLVVRPQKGAALLWYNHGDDGALDPRAVHAGCRVHAGEKWGANHWVKLAKASGGGTAAARSANGGADTDAGAVADGGGGSGKNAARNKKKREKAAAKKREEVAAAAAEAASGDAGPAARPQADGACEVPEVR